MTERSEQLREKILGFAHCVIDVLAVERSEDRAFHRVGKFVLQELPNHLGHLGGLSLGEIRILDERRNHFLHVQDGITDLAAGKGCMRLGRSMLDRAA